MINKSEIFKNKSHWVNMTEIELLSYQTKIFKYYCENGFPYYPTDDEYRKREFNKLQKYNYSELIENGIVKQTMHGLGLAWSYFPHSFDVKCNNKKTPIEVFNNDDFFMEVISKRLQIGTFISDAGIRKMLKMFTNTQGVSNFRPTAAAAIYDKYAANGVVWDMSGGWGGRMLGAAISSVKKYITTEPSIKTFLGLVDLSKLISKVGVNMEFVLSAQGSEIFIPEKNSLNLCFTSPPYFDLEKYSDEDSQSYIKYSNKQDWVSGFLKNTFNNCYYGLKNNGHMLINIADSKKNNNISLEQATIDTAISCGFKHVDTLKLALSNPNMKNRTSAFKYEPIFVFKKYE